MHPHSCVYVLLAVVGALPDEEGSGSRFFSRRENHGRKNDDTQRPGDCGSWSAGGVGVAVL